MTNRIDVRRLFTALLALWVLLSAMPVMAQRPAPFSQLPADMPIRIRVDFEKLNSTPVFKRLSTSLGEAGKPFSSADFVGSFLAPDSVPTDSTSVPGTPAIMEISLRPSVAQGVEPEVVGLVYGNFEPAKVAEFLKSNGYVTGGQVEGLTSFTNAEQETVVTMPNAWTIAIASTPEELGDVVRAGKTPWAGDQNAGASPLYIAATLSDSDRVKLQSANTQVPPEALGMPGVAQLLGELKYLQNASAAVGGNATIEVQMNLSFSDEGASQRATAAANQVVTFLGGIMAMQAANNPEMAETQKLLQSVQFTQAGASSSARMVLPESLMAQVTQGMLQGVEAAEQRARSNQSAPPGAPAHP